MYDILLLYFLNIIDVYLIYVFWGRDNFLFNDENFKVV